MKLVNFASLDPAHQARGVRGLSGTSRADREIWERFGADLPGLATESEEVFSTLYSKAKVPERSRREMPEILLPSTTSPTEKVSSVLTRRMQSFFRRLILAAYESRCCVTGNPIPDLLIASHILPWSEFPKQRLDPQNGLCLAAHFDRAFDSGLITFREDLRLMLGSAIRSHCAVEAVAREFISRDGTPLKVSGRFPPNLEFLAYHRERIFKG